MWDSASSGLRFPCGCSCRANVQRVPVFKACSAPSFALPAPGVLPAIGGKNNPGRKMPGTWRFISLPHHLHCKGQYKGHCKERCEVSIAFPTIFLLKSRGCAECTTDVHRTP